MARTFAAPPAFVDITWMSISNMYYELGSLNIVTDGYITRLPQDAFFGGGGGFAQTRRPFTPDVAAVTRVMNALGRPSTGGLAADGSQPLGSLVRHRDMVEADGRAHHRFEDDVPAGAGGRQCLPSAAGASTAVRRFRWPKA